MCIRGRTLSNTPDAFPKIFADICVFACNVSRNTLWIESSNRTESKVIITPCWHCEINSLILKNTWKRGEYLCSWSLIGKLVNTATQLINLFSIMYSQALRSHKSAQSKHSAISKRCRLVQIYFIFIRKSTDCYYSAAMNFFFTVEILRSFMNWSLQLTLF